jgi:hypothetical protein
MRQSHAQEEEDGIEEEEASDCETEPEDFSVPERAGMV